MRVGIPRALLYHYYRPALDYLVETKAAPIAISSVTNKPMLELGLALCDEEVCLPVKVLVGHVHSLQGNVDALFLPRVVCLEKRRFTCPKILGLPDLVRALLGSETEFISPVLDARWGRLRKHREIASCLGRLPGDKQRYWRALKNAAAAQEQYRTRAAAVLTAPTKKKRVAVLGHAYNIFDQYINFGLLARLSALGAEPVTLENFSASQINAGAQMLTKDLFWNYGRELVGAALYCLQADAVAGVILVASFGCGPDSLVNEIIQQRFANSSIPVLSIILDEHSSGVGLATRLEAFVDMLYWRDKA